MSSCRKSSLGLDQSSLLSSRIISLGITSNDALLLTVRRSRLPSRRKSANELQKDSGFFNLEGEFVVGAICDGRGEFVDIDCEGSGVTRLTWRVSPERTKALGGKSNYRI